MFIVTWFFDTLRMQLVAPTRDMGHGQSFDAVVKCSEE